MDNSLARKEALIGDGLVTLAMLLFGSYALFLRLLPAIPVVSFLFSMQVVGTIAFFFLVLRQGFPTMDGKAWFLLFLLAVAGTANDLFYFYAFRLTSVANASVAHQMVSVFLLFLTPLFLKEKSNRHEGIALAIALLGVAILFGREVVISRRDTLGIILGLLSAVSYAFIILLYRYMSKIGYSIDIINLGRYTISTLLLLPVVLYGGNLSVLTQNFWPLAGFGLLFTAIAARLHTLGMARTRPLHVSIIGKSEPVIATIYATLFLNQIPPLSAVLGGALILGASLWLVIKEERITA